ncbi:hypothetical protein CAPTEDRAFT_210712 [Capitella teleta]|uniref:Endonuclease/exonuclease/phosphatase domain-containing protein n=1 Tax=Capitella teleta TaxID=283909 RepID=R7TXX5_CAPTE|nr:hypothetical protein CAPTEDRAFT_210712 [Capitella teleta]|eukprot:ELT95795.1 hypothetical protein CAPTEDRAFT_210712 [Capitella teleta]
MQLPEKKNDNKDLSALCSKICISVRPTAVTRLGKKDAAKLARPMKVTFSSPFDARTFMAWVGECKKTDDDNVKGIRCRPCRSPEDQARHVALSVQVHKLNETARATENETSYSLRSNGEVWKFTKNANGKWKRATSLQICLPHPWSVCNKAAIINDYIINIDILALTETWFTCTDQDDSTLTELLPRGFSIKQVARKQRGTHSALNQHTQQRTYKTFKIFESIVHQSIDIRLSLVYRAPGNGSRPQQFMDEFRLQQHVTDPTHKSGHTLDLMLSRNEEELISSVEVLDHGFPDHYAVLASLTVKKPPLLEETITYRNIKSIFLDAL